MESYYLLDTNTIIDYVGGKLPDAAALVLDNLIDNSLNISVVVRIEVLGFNGEPSQMRKLADFLALATTYYVDDSVADQTIELRKQYRKIKLGDALIAATALVHGFTLISRNVKDFQNIGGLICINPYELG